MMNKIERQRQHFESVSDRYFTSRQGANHLAFKDLLWSDFFRRNPCVKQACDRVLEPMCGYGEGRALLARYVRGDFGYQGFDYSAPLVSLARQADPGLNISVADVTRFRARDSETFDIVILIGGLHHVFEEAASVISHLTEAIRPGGLFINFEPTHGCSLTRRIRERIYERNRMFDAETERGFAVKELNAMFDRAGLELVDESFPGLLAYCLYYNPDVFPRLCRVPIALVRGLFSLERRFFRTRLAKALSFATLSLWRKPVAGTG